MPPPPKYNIDEYVKYYNRSNDKLYEGIIIRQKWIKKGDTDNILAEVLHDEESGEWSYDIKGNGRTIHTLESRISKLPITWEIPAKGGRRKTRRGRKAARKTHRRKTHRHRS